MPSASPAASSGADVLPLRLGLADLLRVRVALGAHFVRRDLRGLAALLERPEALDVEHEAATREVRGDGVGIGTEQPGVEHGGAAGKRVGKARIVAEISCASAPGTAAAPRAILISSPRGTGS